MLPGRTFLIALVFLVLLANLMEQDAFADARDAPPIPARVAESPAAHGWAVNYPKQRKVFVMAGRLWVFYSDGSDGVFRSSADGAVWSDPTPFGAGGHFGHRFGCWFDGVHLHYALCTAALGADVMYRRGTPIPDGSITWDGPAQTAYDTPDDKNVMYPKVIVDSHGSPWISFMELVYQVPNAPPYDAVVLKSSRNDGRWEDAAGFPFRLVERKAVAGYPDPMGVPLTEGKTWWFYNNRMDGDDVYAERVWNGDAWQPEAIVVRPASEYAFFNAVAGGDDVHLVHGAGTIVYQKRTWHAGWSAPSVVSGSASGHTSITRVAQDHVIITWLDMDQGRVCYRERAGGVWRAEIPWISGVDLAGAGINLNTLAEAAPPFRHAAIYTTGQNPPFPVEAMVLRD